MPVRNGEASEEFTECVAQCKTDRDNCTQPQTSFWTCGEDCEYRCMHSIVTPYPVQYRGKWPFIRVFTSVFCWLLSSVQVLWMQEFLSVVFSLGTVFVFVYQAKIFYSEVQSSFPLKKYFLLTQLVGYKKTF